MTTLTVLLIILDISVYNYNSSDNDRNRDFNPFMHNVVKWLNILWKSCGVNTARFLKYVCPFYSIIHERFNNSDNHKDNKDNNCWLPFLLHCYLFEVFESLFGSF